MQEYVLNSVSITRLLSSRICSQECLANFYFSHAHTRFTNISEKKIIASLLTEVLRAF